MNIVISDTTALIVLARSDTLFLLSNLFEKIFITQAVYNELVFKDDVVQHRIQKFDKMVLKPVSDVKILEKIQKFKLDEGEAESITFITKQRVVFTLRLRSVEILFYRFL